MPEREHRQASASRAFWSGTITWGLVSIPIDLFSAVRGRQTSMRMVDAKGRPLGREYFSKEDDHLDHEELVRGYKTDDGEMVVVTDEELQSIAPEMTRDIELRMFVPREQIPAPYFNRPYFLAPSGRSKKAYQLLAQTMSETGRVGIGTFVMRGKQYLVTILSEGNVLRAETLRFASELRSPKDIGLPRRSKSVKKDVKRFSNAIESLERDEIDMDEMSDQYAAALLGVAEKKSKKGKDVVDPRGEPDDGEEGGAEVIDLMKILKQRLGAAGKAHRKPAAKAPRATRRRESRKHRKAS